ncbi:uncharacterized protein LOC119592370 [Penaeus monodon]|uniref:uncharacterized protein LOC119592370 n=1 Tax=Penaeus monodon TaxID=6687 RepID=UPI0018A7BFAD|nr:uncharacterized protein LOC119592370 [Penaeus monodon]
MVETAKKWYKKSSEVQKKSSVTRKHHEKSTQISASQTSHILEFYKNGFKISKPVIQEGVAKGCGVSKMSPKSQSRKKNVLKRCKGWEPLLQLRSLLSFSICVQQVVIKSIQLDDPSFRGSGYISLAVIYAVFATFNWLAPSCLSFLGPKLTMIVGGVTYVIFIASFLWPQNVAFIPELSSDRHRSRSHLDGGRQLPHTHVRAGHDRARGNRGSSGLVSKQTRYTVHNIVSETVAQQIQNG